MPLSFQVYLTGLCFLRTSVQATGGIWPQVHLSYSSLDYLTIIVTRNCHLAHIALSQKSFHPFVGNSIFHVPLDHPGHKCLRATCSILSLVLSPLVLRFLAFLQSRWANAFAIHVQTPIHANQLNRFNGMFSVHNVGDRIKMQAYFGFSLSIEIVFSRKLFSRPLNKNGGRPHGF